jgi:MarR family transcriptional regulator, organic hydroperoxide resistance regulator
MLDKNQKISIIIDNLRRVFQVVHEQSKKVNRETSITGPQLWAIKVIASTSCIRVSDLAKKMYLHPATVVGILNRLETRGLVERIRTKDDRRVVNVVLTEQGREIVRQSPEVTQGLLLAGLETRTVTKLDVINEGLSQLVEILGAQEIPPQLILSSEVNLPAGQASVKKKKLIHTK